MADADSGAGRDVGPKHHWYVTALVIVATVLAFVATFSLWINRQALNTDNWVTTSGKLLENKAIQTEVATFVVNQLYANVDVKGQLESRLPPQFQPLAGPAAGALHNVAQTAAQRALATGLAQDAWRKANRAAHKVLLKVVDGNNGTVTLNLKSIARQVAGQVGIDPAVADKIPASAESLVILRSKQIDTAQKVARLIRRLAIILTVLVLGLYALAIYLARGYRRETLRSVGLGFIAAGVVALIVRGLAGGYVVDALAKNESVRPAADAVWSIGTSLLVQAAASLITFGILLVIAAVLAGPTRYAVRLRRWAAPYLRERPGATYAAAGAVFLALIAWAPIAAFRTPLGILAFALLMVLGTELLRRQTAREFPAGASRSAARA